MCFAGGQRPLIPSIQSREVAYEGGLPFKPPLTCMPTSLSLSLLHPPFHPCTHPSSPPFPPSTTSPPHHHSLAPYSTYNHVLCSLSPHTLHSHIHHVVSTHLSSPPHTSHTTQHQHHRSPLTPLPSPTVLYSPPGSAPLFGIISTMAMEDVDGCAVECAGGCPYMACWSCVDRAEIAPPCRSCLSSFISAVYFRAMPAVIATRV